ncbi:MAG TPA: HAMP domain-containing sensor histidine kinase, partial [Polyangiales bacterium]|nr:HAMP domain-containing sensor histidine kinase [Polyangiales bacterium]
GIVSHDLRTPLNVILLGASQLLERPGLDEYTLRSLLRVRASGERAMRLVGDLLDFTQARIGGGISVALHAENLHQVVERATEELQTVHAQRTIQHTTQGGAALGCWDADRVVQIVNNLVTNAVKYSLENSPIAVRTATEPNHVTMEVHNEGAPISAEIQARLFEPFQRGPGSQGISRSVGLGLYIVKRLVEAHRGRVSVQSDATRGTTFRVELPRDLPCG